MRYLLFIIGVYACGALTYIGQGLANIDDNLTYITVEGSLSVDDYVSVDGVDVDVDLSGVESALSGISSDLNSIKYQIKWK